MVTYISTYLSGKILVTKSVSMGIRFVVIELMSAAF